MGERLDRRDQKAPGIRLEQIAPRARLEEFADQRLALVHGEDEHFGLGVKGPDLPSGVDPVEDRELVVEDGDMGLRLGRQFDRALAVLGLGDHLPPRLAAQDGVKAGTDNVMVVGDQDAGHFRRGHS